MKSKSICLGLSTILMSAVAVAGTEGPRSFECTSQVVMVLGTYKNRAQVESDTSVQLGLRAIEEKFLTITDLAEMLEKRSQSLPLESRSDSPIESLPKSAARLENTKIRTLIMNEAMKLKPCLNELMRIRQLK
jgi:hypothetical protein